MINLPRLYPILDTGILKQAGISIEDFARELRDAGVRFLQYRDKDGEDGKVLERSALLRRIFPAPDCRLILNDRVHLARPAGFDGVHLGQEDMPASQARSFLGEKYLIGVSTHNQRQLVEANDGPADYLAIGPVFPTASKQNPDPIVGLEMVQHARGATHRPLVAIGGITQRACRAVLEVGADSIAVISGLLPQAGKSTRQLVAEYLSALDESDELSERMPI